CEIPSATKSIPYVDRLDLGVELDRGETLFARAVARSPGSPERHVIVDAGGGQVHHDHAGADVLAEIADVLGTVRDDPGREAEVAAVGDFQSFFVVLDADRRDDRTEYFLAVDAHVRIGVGDHGGLHEVARSLGLDLVAAGDEAAAFARGNADVAHVLLELLLARGRADLRVGRQGGADLEASRLGGERFDEAVVDRVFDDDAARSGAALAGLEETAVGRDRHRLVEIGVGEDDERVLAAHFHLHARL